MSGSPEYFDISTYGDGAEGSYEEELGKAVLRGPGDDQGVLLYGTALVLDGLRFEMTGVSFAGAEGSSVGMSLVLENGPPSYLLYFKDGRATADYNASNGSDFDAGFVDNPPGPFQSLRLEQVANQVLFSLEDSEGTTHTVPAPAERKQLVIPRIYTEGGPGGGVEVRIEEVTVSRCET